MTFLPSFTVPELNADIERWEELIITDFSGGLCTSAPESNIRDNQFTSLINWYIKSDNSLKVRGPFRPYGAASSLDTVLTTAPLSFRFIELSGVDYLVACRDAGAGYEVNFWDSTQWAATPVKNDLTDGYEVEFTNFSINDRKDLIFCNGTDTPQRWNGSGTSTDLGLTAPTAAGSGGHTPELSQGLTGGGNYYYKFSYFYDSSTTTKYGESDASSGHITVNIPAPSTANTYSKVTFTGLPAISGDVTRLYIYRSPMDNDSGPYRRVGYITSGTTFTDSSPTGEEGVETPIEQGGVPVFKHPLAFKNRIWAVDGALNTKGVISQEGSADLFPALSYMYFPEECLGPVAFSKNVYWFTTKAIYITPNGDTDAYPEPLKICGKGCTSYDSIVDVGNGLVFQGEDNIYWVDFNTQAEDGDFPMAIGTPVNDKIQDIPAVYRVNSNACLYEDRYYLTYTTKQRTTNGATIVWDVEKGTRLLKQGLFGAWTSLNWFGNDLQNFEGTLYSADGDNKYISEHDCAGATDYETYAEYLAATGHDISTELISKVMHFGHEWANKIVRSLSLSTETSGISINARLVLNKDAKGEYQRLQSFTLGSGSVASESGVFVWGTSLWDGANWGGSNYGFQSAHGRFPGGSKGRNAQLRLSSTDSEDTNLILIKFYYRTLPAPV